MRALLAVVLVLLVPGAAHAEESRENLEAALQKARHLELFVRDLPAAEKAYSDVAGAARTPELWLRALLGLARVQAHLGRPTAASVLDAAAKGIREAKGKLPEGLLRELGKQESEIRSLLAVPTAPKEVLEKIHDLIELAKGSESSRDDVSDQLLLFGALAAEPLAAELRGPDPAFVSFAAETLAELPGSEAATALAEGLRDPAVHFPLQIVEALTHAHPEVFRIGLGHADPLVRATTAETLGQWTGRDPVLGELLFGTLSDPRPEVRRRALGAGRAFPVALRIVAKALGDDDPGVREQAVRRARELERECVTPETAPLVLELLQSADRPVRLRALYLADEAGGEIERKAVDRGLRDESVTVVQVALEKLRQGDVPWSEDDLEGLVRAGVKVLSGPPNQGAANLLDGILALVYAHVDPSRLELLLPLIGPASTWTGPRGASSYTAFQYLGHIVAKFGSARLDSRFLAEAYDRIPDEEHRAAWLHNYAAELGERAVPIAEAALREGSPALRATALGILARSSRSDRIPDPSPFLEDPSPEVRAAALVILVRRDGAKAIARVAEALSRGPSEQAEQFAWMARSVLRPSEADDLLRRLLAAGTDLDVVAHVFQWFGEAASNATVLAALRTAHQGLAVEAAQQAVNRHLLEAWPILLEIQPKVGLLRALEEIRSYHLGMKEYRDAAEAAGEGVVAKAKRLAAAEDPGQRTAAAYALAALGDRDAISVLLDLVADEDAGVRKAALAALKKLAENPAEKESAKER